MISHQCHIWRRSADTHLMGAVGGLAMHEGRGAQGVLERLPQQRVAPVTCTA